MFCFFESIVDGLDGQSCSLTVSLPAFILIQLCVFRSAGRLHVNQQCCACLCQCLSSPRNRGWGVNITQFNFFIYIRDKRLRDLPEVIAGFTVTPCSTLVHNTSYLVLLSDYVHGLSLLLGFVLCKGRGWPLCPLSIQPATQKMWATS